MRSHTNFLQKGFSFVEAALLVAALGIIPLSAAHRYLDLMSGANASLVRGLAGTIAVTAQMVYTKRQLHPNEQYVCIGTSCASDPIPDTDLDAALGHAPGFIKVTNMGYPVSSVGDGAIRISAAGAVDYSRRSEAGQSVLPEEGSGEESWWIVRTTEDRGLVFIPKTAPEKARSADFLAASEREKCGVYYRALDGDYVPQILVSTGGC